MKLISFSTYCKIVLLYNGKEKLYKIITIYRENIISHISHHTHMLSSSTLRYIVNFNQDMSSRVIWCVYIIFGCISISLLYTYTIYGKCGNENTRLRLVFMSFLKCLVSGGGVVVVLLSGNEFLWRFQTPRTHQELLKSLMFTCTWIRSEKY